MISSFKVVAFNNLVETIQRAVNTPFLRVGTGTLTLSAIAQFLLAILLTIIFAVFFKKILSEFVLQRLGLNQGVRESVATITSYGLSALFCLVLLQTLGISFTSIAVLVGSFGIGIGFAFQDLVRNFISGLSLLIEHKLKVGDFIELEDLSGYIVEISLRSTVIRTYTKRHIVVPNSELSGNKVINWTYQNTKGWVTVYVSVPHESDAVAVLETLLDSAYLEETVSYEYPPEAYFIGFGEYSLDFVLWVWVNHVDLKYKTESSLRFIIEQNLRQHQIRLASPRYDIWHRNPNIVLSSSVENYSHHTNLQNSMSTSSDIWTKPVATRDLLKAIPYFSESSSVELRKLVEVGHRRRLEAGEILYKEGEPGDAFYIILSGSLSYQMKGYDQPTVLKSGQFIGEFSLMLGVPRTVTVVAAEETTVFAISPGGFKQILQSQPKLYDCIVTEMGRHEVEITQQKRRLRELGLINSDYDKNPVIWVKKQLDKLFFPQNL
jgi:potassium efflux system protein